MSVQRGRLLQLLAEPPSASAILLVAPPGYGKTVLLQQYAEDERLVYVNLSDATTREAFVRELIGAVTPRSLRSLGTLLGQSRNPGFDSVLSTWMLVRLRTVETTVVLDDLQHVAADEPTMTLLSRLVEGTRSHIRWLLSSRQMPVLPIGTWLAYSITTLPITERDLSFTIDEARRLAESVGVVVDDRDLASIVDHNAGWPIGIRLALEAWERFRSTAPLLAETRTYLFDYLQTELWRKLTRQQRELTLACALLPRVTLDVLVEAGYRSAGRLLGSIAQKVPFVSKNPDGTYSIHELFRDFVLGAAQEQPDALTRILADLGGALSRQDRFVEALALAMRSKQPVQILSVLGNGGLGLLETGAREAVSGALAALPSSYGNHGIASALRGAIAHSDGNGANAEGLFKAALATNDLSQSLHVEIARRLAAMYAHQADGTRAVALLEPLSADNTLSCDSRILVRASLSAAYAVSGHLDQARTLIASLDAEVDTLGTDTRVRVLDRMAFALFYCGDYPNARQRALDASSLAVEVGLDRIAAVAFSVLVAITQSEDTDSKRLMFYTREQAVAAERAGDRGILVRSLNVEYLVAAQAGDRASADRVRNSLDGLGEASVYRDNFNFAFATTLLESCTGSVEKAAAILDSVPEAKLTAAERIMRTAFSALLDLLLDRRAQAAAKVGPGLLTEISPDSLSLQYLALAHGFRSLALWMLDRPAQAARALGMNRSALPARDEVVIDAIRKLTSFPHPLPNILAAEHVCEEIRKAGMGAFASLLHRLASHDKTDIELTPAELQLLRTFYEHGGRTADVAATLRKSPYTVRNQIRSAIAKIGCAGRNEAIIYARQRGWF